MDSQILNAHDVDIDRALHEMGFDSKIIEKMWQNEQPNDIIEAV